MILQHQVLIYVERYRRKTNLVLLDPDVAQAFPNDEAVNEALRLLIQVAQRQQPNTTTWSGSDQIIWANLWRGNHWDSRQVIW